MAANTAAKIGTISNMPKTITTPGAASVPKYSLRCYPSAGFPKFIDAIKTHELARQRAAQSLKDGHHTVEIMRETPDKIGYFGIERELVQTLH